MDGETANIFFTDPPYNVDYEGYTAEHLSIQNDSMESDVFAAFLTDAFTAARNVMANDAGAYIFHASSWQIIFEQAMRAAGLEVRNQIIWAKNTFGWGFGRYKFQHEPIFYAHVAGQVDAWYGDKSQSTLWQANKPAASREHPTMKPVELVVRAIHNSSRNGDLVLDPFGGSGTAMIAAEQTSRRAALLELDPHYCDVIVSRYRRFSGLGAVRIPAEAAAE